MSTTASPFEGLFIVAKFYLSKAPDGSIKSVSRTLGKFGILENSTKDLVGDREVWVCQIQKEIKPDRNHGAFILKPFQKVENPDTQLRKLIPGFYEQEIVGKTVILHPNSDAGHFWILSSTTRQIFSKKYNAVIVPICFQPRADSAWT
jgi:hypothetical protein